MAATNKTQKEDWFNMATLPNFYLEFDRTGNAAANLIIDEIHNLPSNRPTRIILPNYGAFYSESLRVYSVDEITQVKTLLTKDVHYVATEMLHKVTKAVGKSVCTIVLILPTTNATVFEVRYQALGGHDQFNRDIVLSNLNELLVERANVNWEDIKNKPKEFPPAPHLQDALDLYGLEYVTDQLDQITNAIEVTDKAIHDSILHYLHVERDDVLQSHNDELYTKIDTITALTKSAEDALELLSIDISTVVQGVSKLSPKVDLLLESIADHKHLNANDSLANVANLLCKSRYDAGQSLIDVPTLFDDLVLYLDSSNYDTVNHRWLDKRGTGKGFVANASDAPSYGASNLRPSISAVKFTDEKWMSKNSAFDLTIQKGRTVIAVLGKGATSESVNMALLSSDAKKLSIDTDEESCGTYSDLNGGNVSYRAKTSRHLSDDPLISVINIAKRQKDCLCLTNAPHSYYRTSNNIDATALSLDAINEDMLYLGSEFGHQDAEVYMLLVYGRELSKVEMHSILTYIRLKYDSEVNFLTNPDFREGSINYGSHLTNYPDFSLRDCFKVTKERIALLDLQNTYSDPDFTDPEDIRLDDKEYMLVVSKNPNLSFWNQEVLLDANTRYELRYSLMVGLVNRPIIRLKINGQWHPRALMPDDTRSVLRDIAYTFVPTEAVNSIELFNLNTATTGNSFGIGNVRLVRKIYAQND